MEAQAASAKPLSLFRTRTRSLGDLEGLELHLQKGHWSLSTSPGTAGVEQHLHPARVSVLLLCHPADTPCSSVPELGWFGGWTVHDGGSSVSPGSPSAGLPIPLLPPSSLLPSPEECSLNPTGVKRLRQQRSITKACLPALFED